MLTPEHYAEVLAIWEDAFRMLPFTCNVSMDDLGKWKWPWMSWDGIFDGNPIFTAICREHNIGLRIIHRDDETLSWWIDRMMDGTRELVISCDYEFKMLHACHLMDMWLGLPDFEAKMQSELTYPEILLRRDDD